MLAEAPASMSLSRLCEHLNSAMWGFTDTLIDVSKLDMSVVVNESDFTFDARVSFLDKKTKTRFALTLSAMVIGSLSEGALRELVYRCYLKALGEHRGSTFMLLEDVRGFLQRVICEAATLIMERHSAQNVTTWLVSQ